MGKNSDEVGAASELTKSATSQIPTQDAGNMEQEAQGKSGLSQEAQGQPLEDHEKGNEVTGSEQGRESVLPGGAHASAISRPSVDEELSEDAGQTAVSASCDNQVAPSPHAADVALERPTSGQKQGGHVGLEGNAESEAAAEGSVKAQLSAESVAQPESVIESSSMQRTTGASQDESGHAASTEEQTQKSSGTTGDVAEQPEAGADHEQRNGPASHASADACISDRQNAVSTTSSPVVGDASESKVHRESVSAQPEACTQHTRDTDGGSPDAAHDRKEAKSEASQPPEADSLKAADRGDFAENGEAGKELSGSSKEEAGTASQLASEASATGGEMAAVTCGAQGSS